MPDAEPVDSGARLPLADISRGTESIDQILTDADGTGRYDNISAQIDAGELNSAERELLSDIRQIERTAHRYEAQLIQPLRLLGRIYRDREQHPAAAAMLARATQISRVTGGLHNPEQIDLVHEEIKSLVAMGQLEEANKRHEYAYQIAERAYGSYSVEIVDDLLKLAQWYSDTGNVFSARRSYIHARNLIAAHQPAGASDALLISLRGLATSYRAERYPPYYSRADLDATRQLQNSQLYREQTARDPEQAVMTVNDFQRGTEALIQIVRVHELRLKAIQHALQKREVLAAQQNSGEGAPELADSESAAAKPAIDTDLADDQAASGVVGVSTTPETTVEQAKAQSRADARRARKRARRRETVLGPNTDIDSLGYVLAHPAVDKSDFLGSIVELADWYLLMDKSPRAFALYQHAFRIAETDPNTDAAAYFAEPYLLYYPEPNNPKVPENATQSNVHDGFVALQYQIDHRGHVRRLTTVGTHPPGMMEFQVRRSMGIARYRPRIVDGLPQPTESAEFRHDFRFFERVSNDEIAASGAADRARAKR